MIYDFVANSFCGYWIQYMIVIWYLVYKYDFPILHIFLPMFPRQRGSGNPDSGV
jgi:hypothetical protein